MILLRLKLRLLTNVHAIVCIKIVHVDIVKLAGNI